IKARTRFPANPIGSSALLLAGTGGCLALGVLCKENALLLCAFCLFVGRFCFAPVTSHRPLWRLLTIPLLVAPLLAFMAYVLIDTQWFTRGYEHRNFTAWERLLTQGPVLVDYLRNLLFPRLSGTGLYFDDYPVSRSLLAPPKTLLAWLLLFGWAGLAITWRQRLPLFAFGTGFFFVGHSMESSVLSLELYFEHRNYLPQLGLWLCMAQAALGIHKWATSPLSRKLLAALLCVFIATLASITHANATLWGDDILLAETWRKERNTARAQLRFVNLAYDSGQIDIARTAMLETAKSNPNMLGAQLSLAFIECTAFDNPLNLPALAALAAFAEFDNASLEVLEKLRQPEVAKACKGLRSQDLLTIYAALDSNPHFQARHTQSTIHVAMAELSAELRDLSGMMAHYDLAFAAKRHAVYPYRQATYLVSAGLYEDALAYLDK
ncbi:MAG: hypothetical protein ACK4UT_09450, partial [Moraxellaceae bacterium]